MEWQKVIDQAWRTIRMGGILWAIYAVLQMLGVHLPPTIFEGH